MTDATTSKSTLDQRRAKHAWGVVQRLTSLQSGRGGSNKQVEKYAREAKKLPVRIINSGLGQALAFLLAKSSDDKEDKGKASLAVLHEDLTDWVIRQRPLSGVRSRNSLLESLLDGDAEFLRRATDEVLAYLQWLNRFAEAQGLAKGEDE